MSIRLGQGLSVDYLGNHFDFLASQVYLFFKLETLPEISTYNLSCSTYQRIKFILLIILKVLIFSILIFMSSWNFKLSSVEHQKSFITF